MIEQKRGWGIGRGWGTRIESIPQGPGVENTGNWEHRYGKEHRIGSTL
jgi:hypothetical protein